MAEQGGMNSRVTALRRYAKRFGTTASNVNNWIQAIVGVVTIVIAAVSWVTFGFLAAVVSLLLVLLVLALLTGLSAEAALDRQQESHREALKMAREAAAKVPIVASIDPGEMERAQAEARRRREKGQMQSLYRCLVEGGTLLDELERVPLDADVAKRPGAPKWPDWTDEYRQADGDMMRWWSKATSAARQMYPELPTGHTTMALAETLVPPTQPGRPKRIVTEGEVLRGHLAQVRRWQEEWLARVETHFKALPEKDRPRQMREA